MKSLKCAIILALTIGAASGYEVMAEGRELPSNFNGSQPVGLAFTTDSLNEEIGEADDSQWWRRFGDSVLDSLVTLATERNYNLSMAMRQVAIARQGVVSAKSGYYPQVDISAGWNRTRESGAI
ncbi:MAG: TolC family protein, partial [Muribaculaceae bacterium]|nr:TolC family protein [Muribaculaceae bacterium]